MKTSARIGYEYVYQEIHRQTGYKIHVNELIYKIYDQLPAIQSSLTLDPFETPIHACIYENKKRDQSKTDLMSPSIFLNNSTIKSPLKIRKSYLPDLSLSTDNQLKPLLPCCQTMAQGFKVNSVKIILSAMWFTDTAGVDKIFVKYNPNKKEMESIAYKPYSSIYRLLYSFHSSFEEIVDFVNVLRPKKLHPIALPDSTNEKTINDYFYCCETKTFHGFQFNTAFHSRLKKIPSQTIINNFLVKSKGSNESLVLRKRTVDSFSCLVVENSSDEDESLVFDNSDDENTKFSKKKKAKK